MSKKDEDWITLTQAEEIKTLSGTTLKHRHLQYLCIHGKIVSKKLGSIWLVSRRSIENYKPGEKGFAAVKKRKLAEEEALKAKLEKAIDSVKKRKRKPS